MMARQTTRFFRRGMMLLAGSGLSLLLPAGTAVAGDPQETIGLNALRARLIPERFPTGSGYELYSVNQQSAQGAYGPDQAHPELDPMTFVQWGGVPGINTFVTDLTIQVCGASTGVAPGLDKVWINSVSTWANSLQPSTPTAPPLSHPSVPDIIAITVPLGWSSASWNNTAIRKTDWLAVTFPQLFISSAGPLPSTVLTFPVPICGYNTLVVGGENGDHQQGTVPVTLDGAGRHTTNIVAPGNGLGGASYVTGAAALLYEVIDLDPGVGTAPGSKSNWMRPLLMTATTHRSGWSNGAPQSGPNRGIATIPIDPVSGTDLLNIDRAHEVLTGGRQQFQETLPPAPTIGRRGWDVIPGINPNTSRYYRFRTVGVVDEVSITLAWHRILNGVFSNPTVMNVDAALYRVAPDGTLQSLTGAAGIGVFESGNVASVSTAYNIEHIYLRGLQPGEYVLKVDRLDTTAAPSLVGVAWWMSPSGPLGDLDADGLVGASDLGILLGGWGTGRESDLDRDGITGSADLALLLGAWSTG
jgi:hypothetical protein